MASDLHGINRRLHILREHTPIVFIDKQPQVIVFKTNMKERNKYEYMIVMIFYNICCIADPQ
jgi:uncharacterized membrane protein YcgQ (UPF0703/DUF1980 family)